MPKNSTRTKVCKSYPQQRWLNFWKQTPPMIFIDYILNLFLPYSCVGCGAVGKLLCTECLEKARPAVRPVESYSYALFEYRCPSIKKAIWDFKYQNVRQFADVFAPLLSNELIEILADRLHVSEKDRPLLIPVPLHLKRLRSRGYNQSELLARSMASGQHEGIFDVNPKLLNRTRETKPQAHNETRSVRFKNLQHAFYVPFPEKIKGRIIVLLDDVTTTGATFAEARKTLLASGARDVIALAIAH